VSYDALRDVQRAAADAGRAAADAAGARSTSVRVVVETYSGPVDSPGVTLLSTAGFDVTPRPKVRAGGSPDGYFGGGTASLSSGILIAGQYAIGPITLAYTGGGYTQEQLVPPGAATKRVYYLLDGDEFSTGGEKFRLVDADATRPHQITLIVQRTEQ